MYQQLLLWERTCGVSRETGQEIVRALAREKLQCLHLALFNRKGSVLLHDNTQPHVAQPVLQKLNELG